MEGFPDPPDEISDNTSIVSINTTLDNSITEYNLSNKINEDENENKRIKESVGGCDDVESAKESDSSSSSSEEEEDAELKEGFFLAKTKSRDNLSSQKVNMEATTENEKPQEPTDIAEFEIDYKAMYRSMKSDKEAMALSFNGFEARLRSDYNMNTKSYIRNSSN